MPDGHAAGRARDVPAHEVEVFTPKRHRHALVIPVIDEGERIQEQLRRIHDLDPALDVVIADGGSTDGSVDPAFLRQTEVRALLTKTGPGRLGAQLRMAYGWCLDQGYDGIVTVNGNGKDNMDALPAFIERLAQGDDFVQGSRYVSGGQSVGTPLDRYLAGRLIHAPLISLAARRWYTDTTNGFRGYSRRLLEDPRVAPFRPVFDGYALLFYLSIRAARCGYRTVEVPVIRRYPPAGKTPTKIAGLAGRARMLGELIRAVTGRYDPSQAQI